MFESIVNAVSGSDWSYLIVFVIAMLDAFFPIVPSEATAIAAGVVAAGEGGLQVELVILAAGLGAFVGDNISYAGGHFLGERLTRRFFSSEKSQKRLKWAEKTLRERGPYLIVVARFIPGGRTITTFTASPSSSPATLLQRGIRAASASAADTSPSPFESRFWRSWKAGISA